MALTVACLILNPPFSIDFSNSRLHLEAPSLSWFYLWNFNVLLLFHLFSFQGTDIWNHLKKNTLYFDIVAQITMCLRLRWTKLVVISKVATQSKSTFKCFSTNPLHAHLPFSQQTLIEFHSCVQIMITNNKSVVFWENLVSTKEWGIAPWCENLKAW